MKITETQKHSRRKATASPKEEEAEDLFAGKSATSKTPTLSLFFEATLGDPHAPNAWKHILSRLLDEMPDAVILDTLDDVTAHIRATDQLLNRLSDFDYPETSDLKEHILFHRAVLEAELREQSAEGGASISRATKQIPNTPTGLIELYLDAVDKHSASADPEKIVAAYDEFLNHPDLSHYGLPKNPISSLRIASEKEDFQLYLLGRYVREALLERASYLRACMFRAWHNEGDYQKGAEYCRKAVASSGREVVQPYIELMILNYYSLRPVMADGSGRKTPSPDYGVSKTAITEQQLRDLIGETAALLLDRVSHKEEPPFPILSESEVKAIIAHGKKNQWDNRDKRGWHYHTNAFKYVHVTYRRWVNRGLTREILKWADPSLHRHLKTKITREGGMPVWIDCPSGPDARMRAITDPIERAELAIVRKVSRNKMRKYRAALGD